MDKTFDSAAFVGQVGADLVHAFEKARRATTPGLVGSAMEGSTRESLEQILPRGIAAGSGCVIDSEGRTSRQMDVVLYERDFCPVFRGNNNPETTYFPCEGVIAVGEVKSTVGKAEFDDAVKKVESVKILKRQFRRLSSKSSRTGYGAGYRGYGGTDNLVFASFDPEVDSDGDIAGFLLTDKLSVRHEKVGEYYSERTPLSPDWLIALQSGVFTSAKITAGGRCTIEPMRTSTSVVYLETANPFGFLLFHLQQKFRTGKTSELAAFENYIINEPNWNILGRY